MTASTTATVHVPAPRRKTEVFWALMCWIPIFAFAWPLVFAAIVSMRVGHWPHYNNPDPKDLHLPFLHATALLCYPLAFLIIIARTLALVIWEVSFRRIHLIAFIAGAVAWTLGLPIVGKLLGWLAD